MQVRDGAAIEVKVSRSMQVDDQQLLPMLFVTHGGGWVQGTHITEEARLLWLLLQGFDMVIVSVYYRMAPEIDLPPTCTIAGMPFRMYYAGQVSCTSIQRT